MATWFCYGCQKNMGDEEYCPYCGMHRLGSLGGEIRPKKFNGLLSGIFSGEPKMKAEPKRIKAPKKVNAPIFSEEECFLYGIHPNDEMYKKTIELNVLSRNYKE